MYIAKELVEKVAKTSRYKTIIENLILDNPKKYKNLVVLYEKNYKNINTSLNDRLFINALQKIAANEIYEKNSLFNMNGNFLTKLTNENLKIKYICIYLGSNRIYSNIKELSGTYPIKSQEIEKLIKHYKKPNIDIITISNS